MQTAYQYFFRGAAATPAKGAGLVHLLRDALASGGPHLLVLDGLERVQCQGSSGADAYGQIEDPLLRGLLTCLAEGSGQAAVLVTSRFPLTDLARVSRAHAERGHEGVCRNGYRHLDVGGLSLPAAIALLRSRGVHGDDATLAGLVEAYGAHALTLDHLGGVIGQFLGGDPLRAPEAPSLAAPGCDRQALRLARLLRAHEDHLPPAELALLCRLCLLRRSAREEQIVPLFLCSPAVHARTVRELADSILGLPGPGRDPKDSLRELAASIRETVEEALCAAPIAGPETTFRREVLSVVQTVLQLHENAVEINIAELARLYKDEHLDVPSDHRPLSPADRVRLRALCRRYLQLGRHPLMPSGDPAPALQQAFQDLGYSQEQARGVIEDLEPADLLYAIKRVREQLRHLTYKHFSLQRVRELCRLYQRKWAMAGPLAELKAADVRQVLDNLVSRHLALREADGSFSVHPAVRDHFYRLATAGDQGSWHDIIREQLVSLVQRPGKRLAEDRTTLDLVEEAIYHAKQAGRTEEAVWLYSHVLGGVRHLGWKLGEMARGLRILRGFELCPDCWALGWYLRALGEFEEAYAHNALPFFRADIRLLQGCLPRVAAEGDSTRSAAAAFLMGQTKDLPPAVLGGVVPRVGILLYLGRLQQGLRSAPLEGFYRDVGWEGDRVRCQLLLAEVARRQAEPALCQKYLEAASAWVLHSGSVEHLCLLHLVRCRAARSSGEREAAQRAAIAGIHLARQCGLGLYLIELLCQQAELCLDRADSPAAEHLAAAALERAWAADCRFLWGAAEAGHLLGQALAVQQRAREARAILKKTLALRRRIDDPKVQQTRQLLASLA